MVEHAESCTEPSAVQVVVVPATERYPAINRPTARGAARTAPAPDPAALPMVPTGGNQETRTHHLVLPRDTNHYGTLYAGVVMSLALEAAYAAAFRVAGPQPNLVLKRVLDLRCHEPVPVGSMVEIRGREVHRARAQIVVAIVGSPFRPGRTSPWLDASMQFVQVDSSGRPEPLPHEPVEHAPDLPEPWSSLRARALRLMAVRS